MKFRLLILINISTFVNINPTKFLIMKKHLRPSIFLILFTMFIHHAFSQPVLDWAFSFGGTGNDVVNKMVVDGSGNIFVAGYFNGTVDFNPDNVTVNSFTSVGSLDIFLAKYDSNGNYLWAIALGSTGPDAAYGLALDPSGNPVIAGSFTNTVDFDPGPQSYDLGSWGINDIFVARYNSSSGSLLWANTTGGSSSDEAKAIAIDAAGNMFITGSFRSTVDFDWGVNTYDLSANGTDRDIFLAKYNAAGDLQWAFAVGGTAYDDGTDIALDPVSGAIYLVGSFHTSADFDPTGATAILTGNGITDGFLAKYDQGGGINWVIQFGSSNFDQCKRVSLDAAGNVYVTGYFDNTIDFDPGVNTNSLTSNGSDDIFLASYNAVGNYLWAVNIGGSGSDSPYGLYVTANDIVLCGYFNNTVDFDPGLGVFEQTSAGVEDIFAASFSTGGTFNGVMVFGGSGTDVAYDITVEPITSKLYLTGSFESSVDFMPGSGQFELNSNGARDVFLSRFTLDDGTVAIQSLQADILSVFPVPANEIVMIDVKDELKNATLTVFNTVGQQVAELKNLSGKKVNLSIWQFAAGIYNFVLLENNGQALHGKFVVK